MTWWNVMLTSISKWQISWNKRISLWIDDSRLHIQKLFFEAQENAMKWLQNVDTNTSELCHKIKLFITSQVINLPLVTIRIKQNTSRDTELMHHWRKWMQSSLNKPYKMMFTICKKKNLLRLVEKLILGWYSNLRSKAIKTRNWYDKMG